MNQCVNVYVILRWTNIWPTNWNKPIKAFNQASKCF